MANLEQYIRTIEDFPKPGIGFKDITTLLKEPHAFKLAIERFVSHYQDKTIHKVVGIESRGFIFATPVAMHLNAGFIPARKPKKLPAPVIREEYQLEYGTDALEMHIDAIDKNDNVLIIDDLLATGGTAAAVTKLVERANGNIVGIGFLLELDFLNGRQNLQDYEICSLIHIKSE